jgi:hypothetical protein
VIVRHIGGNRRRASWFRLRAKGSQSDLARRFEPDPAITEVPMVPSMQTVVGQGWSSDIAWSAGCLLAGVLLFFVWANVPA